LKKHNRRITAILSIVIFLLLLIDAKTVIQGAKEGVELCVKSVIPSLFPFIVASYYLNTNMMGMNLKLFSPIGMLLKLPRGYESILIPAYLGGYPVGAQCVNEAYVNGAISKQEARRLMGFCSNAGPAFIFGFGSLLFSQHSRLLILWVIHILSSVLVSFTIPVKPQEAKLPTPKESTLPDALTKGIRSMASVCGWVVLFRSVIAWTEQLLSLGTSSSLSIALAGFLELTNGCVSLLQTDNESIRFLLFSLFISFGGLCVYMQTVSAAKNAGAGYYFPGKILQSSIAYFLTVIAEAVIYSDSFRVTVSPMISAVFLLLGLTSFFFIKNSSNREKNVV